MTLERAVELLGLEKDKVQVEAGLSEISPDRRIYLWGLQDGYRNAIEILTGQGGAEPVMKP